MKTYKIGIIGLGYVGFPLACLFAKKYTTIGYDPYQERVEQLNAGNDSTAEIDPHTLQKHLSTNLSCTTNPTLLKDCNVYIIAVPTPIDLYQQPDLTALRSASHTVATLLKEGDIVIYESTVYPGVTEEVCVPILASVSALTYNSQFFVGYSPERINPGDKQHKVENICKITSGSTPAIAAEIDTLYNSVLTAGTYPAPSIKVAEMAKVIENAQRDVNIAFMNEIAKICNLLNIDTHAVIQAASSKWNFLPFQPGLVGGHCIGVDPYYLIQKAKLHGLSPRLMMEARKTKENCPDLRNTKVIDIYRTLENFTNNITVYDPLVSANHAQREYGISVLTNPAQLPTHNDVIVLCVPHTQLLQLNISEYLTPQGIIYDVKGKLPPAKNTYRL